VKSELHISDQRSWQYVRGSHSILITALPMYFGWGSQISFGVLKLGGEANSGQISHNNWYWKSNTPLNQLCLVQFSWLSFLPPFFYSHRHTLRSLPLLVPIFSFFKIKNPLSLIPSLSRSHRRYRRSHASPSPSSARCSAW
jgi:hypothetical protein